MTSTQGMRRRENIADILNNIIEQAARTRQGFTPEVVSGFYEEGLRASQNRAQSRTSETTETERQRHDEDVRISTPSRQLGNVVVRRREDETQSETRRRTEISPVMTRQAVEAAVNLGERLEQAAAGGSRLDLRNWVSG